MKHFFATLIFLGLVNQALGQHFIAMETTNIKQNVAFNSTKSIANDVRHLEFLSVFSVEELPKIVHNMHLKVAQFNIKDLKLYTPKEKAFYNVVFNEGNHKIEANYDYEGELVQTKETYENVRIPYSLSSKLAKEYPGWGFKNTLCKITYNKSESPKITYHITMDKGSQKKTVKVSI